MPAVSVIIPSYNHEKYIGKAVQSVLNQTFGDLELIIVDDGSSDQSLQVLSAFSDPRLKIYSQPNQGAHHAINRGLELASGEFLAILNSDDKYYPQRLEKMVAVLKKLPNVGLIGSYIEVIDQDDKSLGIKHGYHDLSPWALMYPERSFRNGADLRLVLLTENYWSTTSNYLFRRCAYEQVGPFRPLRYSHDWDFGLRMACAVELLMVPEPLMAYRIHQSNTIRENQAAMVYEDCWVLAFHLPHAMGQPWFKHPDQNFRYNQLFNSIYIFQCEKVLSLFLTLDIAHRLDFALELLNRDHLLRTSCIEYINTQLASSNSYADSSSPRPMEKPGMITKFLDLFKNKLM